jgi:hypothetical protein
MSSGCHLCRYRRSDDDVEWQPCHFAGAAVAVSSLGSALAIDMMVGGGAAPPLAAWLGPILWYACGLREPPQQAGRRFLAVREDGGVVWSSDGAPFAHPVSCLL